MAVNIQGNIIRTILRAYPSPAPASRDPPQLNTSKICMKIKSDGLEKLAACCSGLYEIINIYQGMRKTDKLSIEINQRFISFAPPDHLIAPAT